MQFILGLVASLLLSSTVASPILHGLDKRSSVPPSQDPFYTSPSNIKSYKPGAVIRSRNLPPQLPGTVSGQTADANLKGITQYMYRTTDALGNAAAAVNTLLIPLQNAQPDKLLSYQWPYDSSDNDCSPSWSLQSASNNTDAVDEIFMIAALKKGYYVLTADYEGLRAEFVSGIMSGYATLDSIRAVLQPKAAAQSGLSTKAQYVLWGYSGGALASEWASELLEGYAPELKPLGAALGGLTPNASNVLYTINSAKLPGLAFSGITGLARIWPNATAWLNKNLIHETAAEFFAIAEECSNTKDSAGKNVFDYFINGSAAFNDVIPQQLFQTNGIMGLHGVPQFPLYFYKAAQDEISPVADTDALYAKLCSKGATIQYDRNLVGDHLAEALTGAGAAFEWVQARFNGTPVPNQGYCVENQVAESSLDVNAFEDLGEILIAALQSALTASV